MNDSDTSANAKPVQPPRRRIGNYELIRLLGKGGMGEVWLARDLTLRRDVALKLLPKSMADNPNAVKRFLREARAAAQLNHPNGVIVYQIGEHAEQFVIAMELVDGGNLAEEISRRGALPWAEATRAIRDAAACLGAAHEIGLVHRDIKPSNLMRSKRGFVKVVDFGLARTFNESIEVTRPGAVLGTPAYMSPEQGRGEKADARSDLYSLTCTYYNLLVGKPPFQGETSTSVIYQHVHEPLPDLLKVVPGLPDAVARVIARGMAKDPNDRYQKAEEMIGDLDNALAEAGKASLPSRTRRRRMQLVAGIAAAVFIVAASALLWKFWPQQTTPAGIANPSQQRAGVTIEDSKVSPPPVASPGPSPSPQIASATPPKGPADVALPLPRPAAPAATQPATLDLGNNVTMNLVLIPAGTFMMGSPDKDKDQRKEERPQHEVTISKAFYMGADDVTAEQFKQIMGKDPSDPKGGEQNPVVCVTWDDAVSFCKQLSAKTGRTVRLPTEAEWEYACRAGSTTRFCFGDDDSMLNDYAWNTWNNDAKAPHPVGQRKPNAWGLYDMHGNVNQWCSDWYADSYADAKNTDPQGPASGTYHVLRGGTYSYFPVLCRSAARKYVLASQTNATGFRVVVEQGDQSLAAGNSPEPLITGAKPVPPGQLPDTAPPLPRPASQPSIQSSKDSAWWDGKETIANYAARAGIKTSCLTLDLGSNVTMSLVLIPAGKFMMGSPENEKDRGKEEGPRHEVTISNPFYMGACAVTQEQYQHIVGKNPSDSRARGDKNPVVVVSWDDAMGFCKQSSAKTGKTVRLPTEAEWEYACRAGSTTRFYYGDDDDYSRLGDYAWNTANSENHVHPVGQKKPNDWGLYDLYGNVQQWCADRFDKNYYANSPKTDPQCMTSDSYYHVLRGSGYSSFPAFYRSASRRVPYAPQGNATGFRVVVELRGQSLSTGTNAQPMVTGAVTGTSGQLPGVAAPSPRPATPAATQPATLDLGNKVTMKLVLIPAGKFMMGSLENDKDRKKEERPQHEVTISKAFYMGVYDVTQEQYKQVVGKDPGDPTDHSEQCPVVNVTWEDAVAFCKQLSAKTRKTVRLPTEAEWEYACRAGSTTRFYYGDDESKLGDYAWYFHADDRRQHPVGLKKPNDWGLYDMLGNVRQWCSDWYADSYADAKGTDPQGPASGACHVLRGCGISTTYPTWCRPACRHREVLTDNKSGGTGFRVVVEAK